MTRKFILGSDWWTDCDDAVAIRLLCAAHRKKRIELLGIVLDACMEFSVPSLDAFLQTMDLHLPVALDRSATDFGGRPPYQKNLAALPVKQPLRTNGEAEDPVRLYRRLLAAEDRIELIEIGYPQVLAALLKSPPDDISPLPGAELVRAKVPCLWIMAGKWDADGERENNFCRNRRASENAAYLCSHWPGEMIFLGWEAGYSVITGGHLPPDDPLKQVLIDHGSPNGRSSWDPMLVRLAVCGDCGEAGYELIRGTAEVDPEDGSNRFRQHPDGRHGFVRKRYPDSWYEEQIDREIAL